MARQRMVVAGEVSGITLEGKVGGVNVDEFVAPVEARYEAMNSLTNEMLVEEGEILTMYKELEKKLQVGDGRHEHGHIVVALDAAESNFRLAHRLYTTSRIIRQTWELDAETTNAKLRSEATAILSKEKEEGKRSKQITDGDVVATMASLFHDEWRAQEEKKIRWVAIEKSLENLVEAWASRCRSLQAMLTKSR